MMSFLNLNVIVEVQVLRTVSPSEHTAIIPRPLSALTNVPVLIWRRVSSEDTQESSGVEWMIVSYRPEE